MPEPRTPVMTLVEVSWEEGSGTIQTVPARMENKSPGGACIRVKTPIKVGAKLDVQWRFEQFSGVVKYCRSEGREYLVGVQRDAIYVPIPRAPQLREGPAEAAKPVEAPVAELSQAELRQKERQDSELYERPTAPQNIAGITGRNRIRSSRVEEREIRHRIPRAARPAKPVVNAGKERKPMTRKWLDIAPWRKKQDTPSAHGDARSQGNHEKENPMQGIPSPTEKSSNNPVQHSHEENVTFQVELVPMEDIYRTAGIMLPPKGYTIKKVVEMLNSDHIRGQSKEMKRIAVLMALDAAGVPMEEILRDAKVRQEALDAHEAEQKKRVEAEWERKKEENVQIEAELERVKTHQMARIARNLDAIAREKATFGVWQAMKQQESQSIAEAVELCSKSTVLEVTSPVASPEPVKPEAAAPAAKYAAEAGKDKDNVTALALAKAANAKPV